VGCRGVELWVALPLPCLSLVGLDLLSGVCVRGTPFWVFLIVLSSSSHREPVTRTVLADLLNREVLYIQSFHKKPSTQPRSIVPPICYSFRVNVAENQ